MKEHNKKSKIEKHAEYDDLPFSIAEDVVFKDWENNSCGNFIGWSKDYADYTLSVSRESTSIGGSYHMCKMKKGYRPSFDWNNNYISDRHNMTLRKVYDIVNNMNIYNSMKELENIEKIKELYLSLDARERILFSTFYNECVEKELTERKDISKDIEIRLVNLGMNSNLTEQMLNNRRSMKELYGSNVQDSTSYPVPVTHKGIEVGIMNSDGSMTFNTNFDTSQLFTDHVCTLSSRSLGEVSINGKLQKVTGIELSFQETNENIHFDFAIDEVVELPGGEIGIIEKIDGDTSNNYAFPYMIKIIHAIHNNVGEVLQFRKNQLKHVQLSKLLK